MCYKCHKECYKEESSASHCHGSENYHALKHWVKHLDEKVELLTNLIEAWTEEEEEDLEETVEKSWQNIQCPCSCANCICR